MKLKFLEGKSNKILFYSSFSFSFPFSEKEREKGEKELQSLKGDIHAYAYCYNRLMFANKMLPFFHLLT